MSATEQMTETISATSAEAHTPVAHGHAPPTLNDIRRSAYKKWEAAGKPPGDCTRFWLEAEQELLQAS
jgi:hypothetical protein